MLYVMTVSGRFPEYSAILKISTPHRSMSSNAYNDKYGRKHGENHAILKQLSFVFIMLCSYRWRGNLVQKVLMLGGDTKSWDACWGETWTGTQFPHSAYLTHGSAFLFLLACCWHNLHILLFLCNTNRALWIWTAFYSDQREIWDFSGIHIVLILTTKFILQLICK